MASLKALVIGLFKLIMVVGLLVVILLVTLWYFAGPANEFCDSLVENENYESLISKAERIGYRVYGLEGEGTLEVIIPLQDSPFFRFACVVTIENNKIIGKEVRADD